MEVYGVAHLCLFLTVACSGPGASKKQPAESKVQPIRRTLTVEQAIAALWPDDRDVAFRATTMRERAAIEELVPRLLNGAATQTRIGMPPAVQQLVVLELWRVAGENYWALRERAGSARGFGSYLFRASASPAKQPLVLQAPHAYFDRDSGAIAARIMFEADPDKRVRALFANSVHRFQNVPGARKRKASNPADLAHSGEHAYTIATAVLANSAPRAIFIQLHGFADTTPRAPKAAKNDSGNPESAPRNDPAAATTTIVSAGRTQGSTALSTAVAHHLRRVLGAGVRRFPEDTLKLGATTNAQMRRLGRQSTERFVHIELSAATRKKIMRDGAQLRSFATALFEATR